MLTRDCKQLSCVVRFYLDCVAALQLAHNIMVRKYNVKSRRAKRKSRLDQCCQDRTHSSLRLPLGDFVVYPIDRPSIRTLVRRIADLGYLVEVFLFPHNDLQALPLGDRHWGWLLVTLFLLSFLPQSPLIHQGF